MIDEKTFPSMPSMMQTAVDRFSHEQKMETDLDKDRRVPSELDPRQYLIVAGRQSNDGQIANQLIVASGNYLTFVCPFQPEFWIVRIMPSPVGPSQGLIALSQYNAGGAQALAATPVSFGNSVPVFVNTAASGNAGRIVLPGMTNTLFAFIPTNGGANNIVVHVQATVGYGPEVG